MGQKTHPIGFRLGGVKDWQAHWFAAKASDYRALTLEDQVIRKAVRERYGDSGAIARVEIERGPQDLVVTISTARPGIVIGRGGQRVDELRGDLERLTGKRARLNIQEVRQPELDATLVARNVAEQLERRIAYRRALRLTMQRTTLAGARGIKIIVSGRLGGAEIARTDGAMEGRIPLHTLRADIDFAIAEARTTYGQIGVKVWIYKGDVMSSAEAIRTRALDRMTAGSAPSAARGGRGRGRPPGRREGPAAGRRGGPPPVEPEAAAPAEPEAAAPAEPEVKAPEEPEAAAPAEPEAAAPAEPEAEAPKEPEAAAPAEPEEPEAAVPAEPETKAPEEPEVAAPAEPEAAAPAEPETKAPAAPKRRARSRSTTAASRRTTRTTRTSGRRRAKATASEDAAAPEEDAGSAEEEPKPDDAGSSES